MTARLATRPYSMSSIIRGLRREEQPTNTRRSTRSNTRTSPQRSKDFAGRGRTAKAFAGAASDRTRHKLEKKLSRRAEKKDEESPESTRQTRRKRFQDPDSGFGKKSMVYLVKHGALKDAVKLPDPVQTRQDGSSQDGFRRRLGGLDNERAMRGEVGQDGRRHTRGRFNNAFEPSEHAGQRRAFGGDRTHGRRRPGDSDERPAFQGNRDHGRRGPDNVGRRQAFESDRSSGHRHARRGDVGRADELPDPRSARRDNDRSDHSRGFGRTSRLADDRPRRARDADTPQPPRSDILELASADSVFVYGRSSVKAALERGRRRLYKLYVAETRKTEKQDEEIMQLARERRIAIKSVPTDGRGLLDKMSEGRPHNGVVLEASPLPQLPVVALGPVEEKPGKLGFNISLGHQSKEEERVNGTGSFIPRGSLVTPKPFVLLLNNILDPGNLGALLRSAHYFGVDAVAMTVQGSSRLSATAIKAASGAAEDLNLFSVPDAVKFVEQSKAAGWKTYAAVPPPSKKLLQLHGDKFVSELTVEREDPLQNSPCLLVLGNEGTGLVRALKSAIDYEVAIPKFVKHSQLDSLNVSVAGALLCHSFVKGSAAEAKTAANARATAGEAKVSDAMASDEAESQDAEVESERMF